MAARTVDPAFFANLPAVPVPCENAAGSNPQSSAFDDGLGAFRGLAFAIVIEGLCVILGLGGWELVRWLF